MAWCLPQLYLLEKGNPETMKLLVVGDAHVKDGQDHSRFSLLSKLIWDTRPDVLLIMGDFVTLECLSAWDKDKRKVMEGKRYQREIEAGNEALDLIDSYKRRKRKGWGMQKVFIMGNHEDRLRRYLEYDPTFAGYVDISKDLRLPQRGYTVIPYGEYHYANGIGFTHIPFTKVGPISGVDITRKATMVNVESHVFGHTHEFCVGNKHVVGMAHLQQVLNCGCFFEEHEDYVRNKVTNYWKGVMLLHSYKEGRFDVETFALGRLRRMYDGKDKKANAS